MEMGPGVIAAGLAALMGSGMGLASLIVPRWGASVVRLQPVETEKGGWAEFRASYGGFFLFMHLAVLMAIAMQAQASMASVIASGFAVGAAWIGMALGRILSMIVDHAERETRTRYNAMAVAFEAAMGLALMAPFIGHLGG